MRRLLVLAVGFLLVSPLLAQAPTAEQKQATVAFLRSMQKENGGFAGDASKDAALRSTVLAIRALKYFGGAIPEAKKCEQYLLSERDPSGGFRMPFKRTPDSKVILTAIGVIGLAEINKDPESFGIDIDYLLDYARSFDDIRMAAAALETVYGGAIKFPVYDRWLNEIRQLRNNDGTWGSGGDRARSTAGAVVTILRLGGQIDNKEEILKILRDGQRPDGAWGNASNEGSDLVSTYQVMRAFVMLKAKPDVAACEAFVAKCRNENGSYKPQLVEPSQQRGNQAPAQPPDAVSCTYYAGAIFHWLEAMK